MGVERHLQPYAAIGVNDHTNEPDAIVNVSPLITARDTVNADDPKKFPADAASQYDTCEYVSDVETEVQLISALDVTDPPDAAANVAACREVLPAAFDAPAEPGSPVCNFTYTATGAV